MSDDKTKSGSPDRDRISTSEEYEVRYWAEKFGVSHDALRQAVKDSGSNNPETVEKHLNSR